MAEKAGLNMVMYLWSVIKQYSPDASSTDAQRVADRIINNDYSVLDFKKDFDVPDDVADSILSEVENRLMESNERHGNLTGNPKKGLYSKKRKETRKNRFRYF